MYSHWYLFFVSDYFVMFLAVVM